MDPFTARSCGAILSFVVFGFSLAYASLDFSLSLYIFILLPNSGFETSENPMNPKSCVYGDHIFSTSMHMRSDSVSGYRVL